MNVDGESQEPLSVTQLKQTLYYFPHRFSYRHDRIAAMRFELRCWFLRQLTGEYASYLFGDESIEQRAFLPPKKWLPVVSEHSHSHHGRPCARKLERGEPTHRCLTCGLDDTCVLCKYCFNPADHEGHNVFVKISSRDDGGICDCGDPEAWKRDVHCLADRGPQECRELPQDFRNRASLVLDVMFDYVVDVLSSASMATKTAKCEEVLRRLSEASELDNNVYGAPPRTQRQANNKKWCLLIWDDDKKSVTDLRSSLQLATERSEEFTQMIVRRIQNSGRATVAISSSLSEMLSMRKKIKHFTTSIRSTEDVLREEMVLEIISVALDLCHCCISQAEPTSLVKLVGEALLKGWSPGNKQRDPGLWDLLIKDKPESNSVFYAMSDLCPDSRTIPDYAWKTHLKEELGEDCDDITASLAENDEELFGPGNILGRRAQDLSEYLISESRPAQLESWPIESTTARVKYLIFFDVRLYKALRQKVTDLYVAALVSNTNLKMQMAAVYADVYPLLVDQYTHIDHDPDLSVTTALSTQLFTTPSIATALMETDAFTVYMKMLYDLFSKNGRLNPRVFRNRRLGQVFHEFGYLLWRNTKKELVGSDPRRLIHTAAFLSLFQGLAPMQRQTDQHVEYENERWVYCYATMPFALQLARSVSVGIDYSVRNSSGMSELGMQKIAQGLLHWQRALEEDTGTEHTTYTLGYGPFLEQSLTLKHVNADKSPVSFLHPVHCFLSWLVQLSTINDVEKLKNIFLIRSPEDCTLFEAPMCTLAVLAQISVGYWVRNGYAMRIQLQCYRDATLRDLSYTRDIFLTQVALCILNPNAVFINLVDRFGMNDWPRSTLGDSQQAYYMFDEFLHCLTFLLCDRLRFQGLSDAEVKRCSLVKEILQVLGFETMPYSELTKLVPESLVVDEQFDMVLAECADFSPPKGPHGVGMYSLKPELYKDFDPHYTHFTIARTEEAEKAAEAKLGARHLPPLLRLDGAWANLGQFTRCVAFANFVYANIVSLLEAEASQMEQTLSRVIHLLLMATKDDIAEMRRNGAIGGGDAIDEGHFDEDAIDDEDAIAPRISASAAEAASRTGCFPTVADMVLAFRSGIEDGPDSILNLLFRILHEKNLTAIHAKTELLIRMLHQCNPLVPLPAKNSDEESGGISAEQIRRKEKGKAMQQKVMADFMRQQQSFLQANEMDDDDDEDIAGDTPDNDTSEGYTFPKYCVLCRMPDDEESIFGILTHTSNVNMMRDIPVNDPYWCKQAFSGKSSLDCEHPHCEPTPDQRWHEHKHEDGECVVWGPAFPKEHTHQSTIVQACGHGVHYKCFVQFLKTQQQQRVLTRFSPENFDDGEILCPLCKGLNNCFMPVLWSTNTLGTDTFLKEPEDPSLDMRLAIHGTDKPNSIESVVQSTLSTLHPKFLSAIKRHDFSDSFHSNVRNVLLEQMLRIKRTSKSMKDLDKTYGLRCVYRTLASTISQTEIALRGQTHSTPFGGLVVDQLPSRSSQFLRIFAKYVSTLTGFIMSSFLQLGKAPELTEEVSISMDETTTRLVEMLFLGIPVSGVAAITVIRQAVVTELARIFSNVHRLNLSKLNGSGASIGANTATDSEIPTSTANSIMQWAPHTDPKMTLAVTQRYMTMILRRYAILVYSICGKYDPCDYAGMGSSVPEHDQLLNYLQLPSLNTIIANLTDLTTPEGLAQANLIQRTVPQTGLQLGRLDYTGIYRLVDLPNRLDSMFNIKGRKIPIDPAICLLCGHMCCIQSSEHSPGNVGPCNEHMAQCGITQGLFLLPRRNYILLLLPHGRGTFIPAPYLDLHGEPDENMRRGRPHYLQRLRYECLTRDVWLWNGLPSIVARKLDQNQDTGGWETL